MEKIILPKISEEKIDKFNSKFVIEPLFPGYGATIGNALRRVLLSSIPGTAITSFKIEGISHEFSSVPHVKEDMIEIMLNLKSLKIKSYSKEPVIIKISKKGPGDVTAKDFAKNSNIEIIDSSSHIASLDNKAKFDLEATVEFDRGFRSTEDAEANNGAIGDILVDAAFSPIERVKMEIENTRVGRMTNYDKITLEITTNGTIETKDAMIDAANILIDHFNEIAFQTKSGERLTQNIEEGQDETEEIISQEDVLANDANPDETLITGKTKVEEVGFSPRTTNALTLAGVKTVAGLKRLSDLKLSEIKGLGQKGINEIKDKLSE